MLSYTKISDLSEAALRDRSVRRHLLASQLQKLAHQLRPSAKMPSFSELASNRDNIPRSQWFVTKRNGSKQLFDIKNIQERIEALCKPIRIRPGTSGLFPLHFTADVGALNVDLQSLMQFIEQHLHNGMSTANIDDTVAALCQRQWWNPDVQTLGGRLAVSNYAKETARFDTFWKYYEFCMNYTDPYTEKAAPLLSDRYRELILKHRQEIEEMLRPERDYFLSFFGFMTLLKSYVIRAYSDRRPVEPIQFLYMRNAIQVWDGKDIQDLRRAYDVRSMHYMTSATPTLFNSMLPKNTLNSCYIAQASGGSIEDIFQKMTYNEAKISHSAGGLGVTCSNLPCSGSYDKETNGIYTDIGPLLRGKEQNAQYVSQAGGKRAGSTAITLDVWYADIEKMFKWADPSQPSQIRASTLFYSLFTNDLFFERVLAEEKYSLFDPTEHPELFKTHNEEFRKHYLDLEAQHKYKKQVDASVFFNEFLSVTGKTGRIYCMNKDAINRKSNHKHLGSINSSNLCCEITQFFNEDEVAVCSLSSLSLKQFVRPDGTFDHDGLYKLAYQACVEQNNVLDNSDYPIPEARRSALRHRTIGIGVQAMADAQFLMNIPFQNADGSLNERARTFHREAMETIMFAVLSASHELAVKNGRTYETYEGSPISQGIFQHDMWDEERKAKGLPPVILSGRWDWEDLRHKIVHEGGVYNSTWVALMPTASTSQLLNNFESVEPSFSNIFVRKTLAGNFEVANRYLIQTLMKLNCWTREVRDQLLANNGSIQNMTFLPQEVRDLFRTVYEISPKNHVDLHAERGPFVDQSQSFNLYIPQSENPIQVLGSTMVYGWWLGLKTLSYYTRIEVSADAAKIRRPVETQSLLSSIQDPSRAAILDYGLDKAQPISTSTGPSASARQAAKQLLDDLLRDLPTKDVEIEYDPSLFQELGSKVESSISKSEDFEYAQSSNDSMWELVDSLSVEDIQQYPNGCNADIRGTIDYLLHWEFLYQKPISETIEATPESSPQPIFCPMKRKNMTPEELQACEMCSA